MAQLNAAGRQILEVLRNRLIPWSNSGAPFILMDAPPRQIGSNIILEKPGARLPLKRGAGDRVRVQHWREENLSSVSVPYMGCVVEGEADIVTGTTTAMCRKPHVTGKRWTIQVPQRSFFLMPSFVPHSDGKRVHWERPYPGTARSRIFWIQFQSSGVHCHFCSSDKGIHRTHPLYFIYGKRFLPLAENLIHEMVGQPPQYLPVVYLQLSTLLQLMVRGLLQTQAEKQYEGEPFINLSHSFAPEDTLVQQVTNFIDKNLYQFPLSVENIAAHLHLSPRHFARLFREEANLSVMRFVTLRRMKTAAQLLNESQLNISAVAGHCGYASVPSFIKAFKRYFGMSPSQFREQKNVGLDRIVDGS